MDDTNSVAWRNGPAITWGAASRAVRSQWSAAITARAGGGCRGRQRSCSNLWRTRPRPPCSACAASSRCPSPLIHNPSAFPAGSVSDPQMTPVTGVLCAGDALLLPEGPGTGPFTLSHCPKVLMRVVQMQASTF